MVNATEDARRFAASVAPIVRSGDHEHLQEILRQNWPPQTLRTIVDGGRATGEAAFCLGVVGQPHDCAALAPLLAGSNPSLADAAEEAMWRIWMRGGTPQGVDDLSRAIELIRFQEYDLVEMCLAVLTADEPTFAEAFHQRGIVLTLLDRYEEAAEQFRTAVRLIPEHFAAIQSLGHALALLGDAAAALIEYRRALRIHPRLEGVPEMATGIEAAIQRRRASA